jgi:oxygen-independent coproporphyrinogen-3 oxidase
MVIPGAPIPRALYLHYPFCEHRCHYCDFSVKRTAAPPVEEWIGAIRTELDWWFESAGWSEPIELDTVFVGGGTPSFLGPEGPAAVGELLRQRFLIDPATVEWTVEANPKTFTEEVASAWRAAGANRASLGVQAFDDEVLVWLGRLHDVRRANAAVGVAREAGFESVNIDFMFGLPETVPREIEAEVDRALALGIDHVSAYGLTIEPGTPLARRVESGRVAPARGMAYADEYRRIAGAFRAAGLIHYEVSNFASPGHECRHNWYYWNRSPYLGVGPSAHGFLPPSRVWNVFRWDRYREAVRTDVGPVAGCEVLEPDDVMLERLWLGLRTREGIDANVVEWRDALRERVTAWVEQGWVTREGNRVIATTEGWLRLDELVTEIGRDVGIDGRAPAGGNTVQ